VKAFLLSLLLFPSLGNAKAPELPVEQYRLANGLTVLLSPDRSLPVVSVEIRYKVGSAHEPEGLHGFAHLFEHLMFQGSPSFNDDYFKPFQPIGAAVNGTTSTDRTIYYERLPSHYLELALWMESDRMEGLHKTITQERLENQRSVVLNERRQNYEDRPYGMFWQYLAEELYPKGHPYHHTAIGDPDDLKAATLEDVRRFFKKHYLPANAILAVVGDFEVKQTKNLISRYFSEIPGGKETPWPEFTAPETEGGHRVEVDEVKLPRIHLIWRTPALYRQGDAEMDLLSTLLTDGKSSRLYHPLVYESAVAKDVTSFQVSRALGSFFVIRITAAPGKSPAQVMALLEPKLKEALSALPSEEEMQRALNGWRKSFFHRVEGVQARASLLTAYCHLTGHGDYLKEDLQRYEALKAVEVQAATRRWLLEHPPFRIDILPRRPQP